MKGRLPSLELRTLVPVVLALVFAIDLALRFAGMEPPPILEKAVADPSALGPFKPGMSKVFEHSGGDLARMGNLPAHREYHRESFSADEFGFRNPPRRASDPPPDAILMGSSFTIGSAMEMDETFPAQIGKRTGLRIYNAGNFGGAGQDLAIIRELARRLGMTEGIVLCEAHTRIDFFDIPETVRLPRGRSRATAIRRFLRQDYWLESPLRMLAERLYRSLQDDRILPNPAAGNVTVASLDSGGSMLFYPDDARVPMAEKPDRPYQFWRWLAEELRRDHLQLAVVIVPSKTLVYGPLSPGFPARPEGEGQGIRRLLGQLNESGIPAIDVTPALQRESAASLQENRLLFLRDDTHWNRDGARVAAEEVSRAWRGTLLRSRGR